MPGDHVSDEMSEVDGTRFAPPVTNGQARAIAPLGLLADEPAGLERAWATLEEMWGRTVDRARKLPSERLDVGVNGEWSFLQTIRHLIFVTDVWLGEIVEERDRPFHALGVPPHFAAGAITEHRLTVDERPSLDEVLAVRAERQERARTLIAQLTMEELNRRCAPRDGRFTVLGAVQVVIIEEVAHRGFAKRDLAVLEA